MISLTDMQESVPVVSREDRRYVYVLSQGFVFFVLLFWFLPVKTFASRIINLGVCMNFWKRTQVTHSGRDLGIPAPRKQRLYSVTPSSCFVSKLRFRRSLWVCELD